MKKLMVLFLILVTLFSNAVAEGLPLDGSLTFVPAQPSEACFSEAGYEDETITVAMERIEVDDATYNVARVRIADASQLRTALADPVKAKKTNKVSAIAKNYHAVVAIGGDYFTKDTYGYVVRQGEVFRKNPSNKRDMLVIDGNGDFHILPQSNPAALKTLMEAEAGITNVFNFGPALVIDGQVQTMPEDYKYNIHRKEPRCAIGQTGSLEYLLVVVDGRRKDSDGCTCADLAQFMADQGCTMAYNLDGGNSALMYFHGDNYSDKSVKAERSVSDIIYFATGVGSTGE